MKQNWLLRKDGMTQKEKVNWITREFSPMFDLVDTMEYLKNINKLKIRRILKCRLI